MYTFYYVLMNIIYLFLDAKKIKYKKKWIEKTKLWIVQYVEN